MFTLLKVLYLKSFHFRKKKLLKTTVIVYLNLQLSNFGAMSLLKCVKIIVRVDPPSKTNLFLIFYSINCHKKVLNKIEKFIVKTKLEITLKN